MFESNKKMSKRSRLTISSEENARKAGLRSFETAEGRAWLWKALNPQNVETAAIGIPSYQSNNISCLNYQSQYDITPPANISATAPSYDVDLFLNHNPLLFGTAITAPTGTMDLSEIGSVRIRYEAPAAGATRQTVKLVPENTPKKTVALRTATQLINSQINPEVFHYSGSLASRRVLYSQLTQKARMTYGMMMAIPTCSDMNNGGLITACQQICEPRKTMLDSANGVYLNSYELSDFPDITDTIQNPQMYSARYNDGCYMPYKMREPFTQPYISSEREVTSRSPYVVTGLSFIAINSITNTPETEDPAVAAHTTFNTEEIFLTWNNQSATFEASAQVPIPTGKTHAYVAAIKFYVVNLLGQRGYFYISLNNASMMSIHSETVPVAMSVSRATYSAMINDSTSTPVQTNNLFDGPVFEGNWPVGWGLGFTNDAGFDTCVLQDNYVINIPNIVTFYDVQSNNVEAHNPVGLEFGSLDITLGGPDDATARGTIPDMLENEMATVHMTGVSNTAPIKLILKMGVEILLTSGSPYSPFKFISPKYDESALKSYLRCTRIMRDAFYANSGGAGGQVDFIRALTDLIENDTAMPLSRIMNQGGNYVSIIG